MNRHLSGGLLLLSYASILAAQSVSYNYDQAGRLISVVYPTGTIASYTYDASGNLLRKVIAAPNSSTPAPAPFQNGVVNAASEQGTTVAPGEIVAIFGNGVGPATLANAPITLAVFRQSGG